MTSIVSALIAFWRLGRARHRLNTHLYTFSCAVTKTDRPRNAPSRSHQSRTQTFPGYRNARIRRAVFVFLILDSVFVPGRAPHHHHRTLRLAHLDPPKPLKSVRVPNLSRCSLFSRFSPRAVPSSLHTRRGGKAKSDAKCIFPLNGSMSRMTVE